MILNYDRKTFVVQATGLCVIFLFINLNITTIYDQRCQALEVCVKNNDVDVKWR